MSKLNVVSESQPWYRKGLRFKCTECGKCCTGAPGYTWIKEEEILKLAEYFGMSVEQFSRKYLRTAKGKYALLEKKGSYDCIFLEGKKCSVYPLRPVQCRTFPWWQQNLESEEAWKEAAEMCEGISDEAPLVDLETIQYQLQQDW